MDINIHDIEKITEIFLKNYKRRHDGYSKDPVDVDTLHTINRYERRVISLVRKNLELLGANESKWANFKKMSFDILDALEAFNKEEHKFLNGNLSFDVFKTHLIQYKGMKAGANTEQLMKRLRHHELYKKTPSFLKKKLALITDVRNIWAGPAVFVELFCLIFATVTQLKEGGEWQHASFSLYLQYYLIVVFIMISELPEYALRFIFDPLLKKLNGTKEEFSRSFPSISMSHRYA